MKKVWIYLLLAALLAVALTVPAAAADASTPHCYCGGTASTGHKVTGCTGNLNQTWSAYTGTTLPASGGYYYLSADISNCGQAGGTNGVTSEIYLDLNGHTVQMNGSSYAYLLNSGAKVTITDFAGGGSIKAAGTGTWNGGVISMSNSATTLNIYGGTLDANGHNNSTASRPYGGAIANAGGGTMNMYGGTVIGGTSNHGGAIYTSGKINLYGGTIKGGTVTGTGGGAVCAENAAFTMYGGTINGGTATATSNGGGAVALYGSTVFTMKGGTISNGVSLKGADYCGGGNILIRNGATFNMEKGIITGGTGVRGGNICNMGTLNISGGIIENGYATQQDKRHGGGNVYLAYYGTPPTCTMTGGTISNGRAANSGGNVCIRYGTFNMSGGFITSDITTKATASCGANVAVTYWTASFNMTGGTIAGGYASKGGAAIAIPYDGGNISISKDAYIEGGKAQYGGALYISAETTGSNVARNININGGYILGGTVTGSSGGTICMEAGTVNITDGIIEGGTVPDEAAYGGGNFAVIGESAVMNISGGTLYSGVAPRGACGYINAGTLNLTGGNIVGVSMFGGTVNVSGKPTTTVALATNQILSLPAPLTGGQVKVICDNYETRVATAASDAIANQSMPYLFSHYYVDGDGSTGTESNLVAVGSDIYPMGAIMYDTAAGEWDYSHLYRIDNKPGGVGVAYKLVSPATYDTINLAAGTLLDLNGYDLHITGEANLDGVILADSKTSAYDSSNGYGTLTAGTMVGTPARSGVDPTTYYRYVTVLDADGKYSAHRIYVGIQSAVLNPTEPSINFRTIMKCDQTVAGYLKEYGALFTGDKTIKSKCTKPVQPGNSNQNPWLTTLANAPAVYFERDFTTCAYMLVDDSWPVAEDKTVRSSDMVRSIRDMVEYADEVFMDLSLRQQNALVAMYQRFTAAMSNGWLIDDISSRANATVWTEAALPTTSGYYKLGKSYTLTQVATPANDAVIWLDLNGYTVTGAAAGMYNFAGVTGAKLFVYDTSAAQTGKLMAAQGCTAQGGVINLAAGNTFTLQNGTIDGSGVTVAGTKAGGCGAAIYTEGEVVIQDGTVIGGTVTGGYVYNGGGAIAVSGENGKLTLAGGTISGGTATCGGAVLVQKGAQFDMTGGQVIDGTAKYDGGNVFAFDGIFNMSGGAVANGTLGQNARYGTNVCLWNTSTGTMSGGTITGGSATRTDGKAYGGVYVNATSTMTVSGKVDITGNTYNDAPSNVYLNGSTLDIGEKGLLNEQCIGVSVEGGNGKIVADDCITRDTMKHFVADDGSDIVFGGNGTPLYVGKYGYQIGYAEGDYGPYTVGIGLSGYGNDAERLATSWDSYGLDIQVLAATDDEGDTVVVCSVEAATIATVFHTQLRENVSATFDIPVDHVLISSNHQHSTPVPGTTLTYCDYATFNEQFEALFMETVKKALLDRQTAEVYKKTVTTSGYNFVRNCMVYNASGKYLGMVTDNHVDLGAGSYSYALQETGAGDYDLGLVWFDRPGKDIVVANFQTHPHSFTGGGSGNTVASAGFTGVFRDIVSKTYDCHTMYISGASGDMNMMPRAKLKAYADGAVLSGKSSLSNYANGLAGQIPALKASNWTKLNGGQVGGLSYAVTLENNKDKAELYPVALSISSAGNNAAKQAALTKAMQGVTDPSKYIYSIYHADAIVNRHSASKTRQMSVYAISIGDVSFGGGPYEMFSKDGKTIKSSDTHPMTMITFLTNGHNGYVPSTDHMNNGGYSADIAYVAKGSSDLLDAKIIELMNQLREANTQ